MTLIQTLFQFIFLLFDKTKILKSKAQKNQKITHMNKTTLHWSYLNIKDVPMDLFLYEELQEIYLKQNFITSIPNWLLNLTNLRFIHLAGNNLISLPEELYLLENLDFLDVSNNKLTELPLSIGLVSSLQRFNVSDNQITEIPKGTQVLNATANYFEKLISCRNWSSQTS